MFRLDRLWRGSRPGEPLNNLHWHEAMARCWPLPALSADERPLLEALAREFLASRVWEGVGGLEPDERLRLAVTVQACLPILTLGLDWYGDWATVLLYPSGFVARHVWEDEFGVVHKEEGPLVGEAWERGPLVLSAEDVLTPEPGFSVVIHECAHKLDMRNGDANGQPPLHPDMSAARWKAVFSAAWDRFSEGVEAQAEWLPFDAYAAEAPGEFFAVASEAFFTDPAPLHQVFPEVYHQMAAFYRQDPLARLTRAGLLP